MIDKMVLAIFKRYKTLKKRGKWEPRKVMDITSLAILAITIMFIMMFMKKIDSDSTVWSLITNYRPIRRRSRMFFWGQ